MTFAVNQWYVAAYGSEVTPTPLGRVVCGEPLVLFRSEGGEAITLADRCIHRRYPLSAGSVANDSIVCGYHGFTYDRTGTCVAVPGQERIPASFRVAAYPTCELDGFVWVWIGAPERADTNDIPRAPWLDSDQYTVVCGMEPLDARYGLLIDNLLDLSHETYLHGGYIGTPEVAATPISTRVDDDASIVHVSRHMDDAECPPFYANSTGISGRITRWQDIEFHAPCLYLLHSRVAPAGVFPPATGPDDEAFHVEIVYAITPSTEHTTYDFWAVARDFARDDDDVSAYLYENNRTVVMQDVVALNLLEKVIASEGDEVFERSIAIDAGGLAARKMMQRLIDASD